MKFDPTQLSREQLLELIQQLLIEQARLRAENEELKRKQARSAAPFSKNQPKQNPKRPGRKAGQGTFRHRPAPPPAAYSGPPEDVLVRATACPACGGELVEIGTEVVTNTELPPLPQPEVKAYRIHIHSCSQCQRKVRAQHPAVAPDQFGATAHRLGPRALAAATTLHYGDGLPQRKVPRVLKSLTGLVLTQGAVTQAALRLGTGRGAVAQAYADLRSQIPAQAAVNTDDTGWRVGGQAAQLMVFDTPWLVVYQIRARHRNEEVLGDYYAGVLCTDRGRSYDAKEFTEVDQQKCLAHILRSIDAVLATKCGTACGAARVFGSVLKSQLQEAIALYHAFHDPDKKLRNYVAQVRQLELEVSWQLRPRELSDPDNQRLLNELGRHHERGNLLRFLHEPVAVAPTNNAAERALRPAVIARKVSQCSKNERGAAAFAAFQSVIGTLKKSGGEVLEKLTQLLTPAWPQTAAPANTS